MKAWFLRGRERSSVAFRAVGNISMFARRRNKINLMKSYAFSLYSITAVKLLISLEKSTASWTFSPLTPSGRWMHHSCLIMSKRVIYMKPTSRTIILQPGYDKASWHHHFLFQHVLWDFQKKSSLACKYKMRSTQESTKTNNVTFMV